MSIPANFNSYHQSFPWQCRPYHILFKHTFSRHRQATIMQSSTVTATKHKNDGTADSNTLHLENVGEGNLSSSADDDDENFVSYAEIMQNAPVFSDNEESTRSMDSHQCNFTYLRVIIDGETYIQNSVDVDNSGNLLKFQEGDGNVKANAITVWQQTQEESGQNSDAESSGYSNCETWSQYLETKKQNNVLAQKPFASLLNDLHAEATPHSQQSFAPVSYLTPAVTTKSAKKKENCN